VFNVDEEVLADDSWAKQLTASVASAEAAVLYRRPKQARARTIPIGAAAPQAAGVIHTDFQRGFIMAEVVSFDDLVAAGSVAAVRAAGHARIEFRYYVVRDDDVLWVPLQLWGGERKHHTTAGWTQIGWWCSATRGGGALEHGTPSLPGTSDRPP
jgi:hypothetical protein